MKQLTVEQVTQVLNHYNIAFTDGAVKTLLQKRQLKAVPQLHNNVRNSKYNFEVELDSLVKMLIKRGISINDIKTSIPL